MRGECKMAEISANGKPRMFATNSQKNLEEYLSGTPCQRKNYHLLKETRNKFQYIKEDKNGTY